MGGRVLVRSSSPGSEAPGGAPPRAWGGVEELGKVEIWLRVNVWVECQG